LNSDEKQQAPASGEQRAADPVPPSSQRGHDDNVYSMLKRELESHEGSRLLQQLSPGESSEEEEQEEQVPGRGEEKMVARLKRELESKRESWQGRVSASQLQRSSGRDSWGSAISESELSLERKSKRESLEKYMLSKDFTAEVPCLEMMETRFAALCMLERA